MSAHWHIVHALVYVGLAADDATRKRRTEECIKLLEVQLKGETHEN